MSGKSKAKVEGASINEQILKECHQLYTDEKNGLVTIAEDVGIHLLAPRKKITVMLIGNHSAGKSSFINWYIEDTVQKTGVAIETQGFTIVTSGRKRESLTGNATLHLYEHLQPLQNLEGVIEYMSTEITTSKQKKFNLVNFIDTPGLVDGDMKYPFDVNKAILWLGENIADLIFVFFDPIGQALCKRTLNIVEKLSEKQADVMKFYLSKADDAGQEGDRQRVMMQIVQELCKRPNLNRTGFNMNTIYIPRLEKGKSTCQNQIEEVCVEIEKTIGATIQNTLNVLERDCTNIAEKIDDLVKQDDEARDANFRARSKGTIFFMGGLVLPLMYCLGWMGNAVSDEMLEKVFGEYAGSVRNTMSTTNTAWSYLPLSLHWYVNMFCVVYTLLMFFYAYFASKSIQTLPRWRKKLLRERRSHVQSTVKKRKEILYKNYLAQSVSQHDL